MSVNSEQKTKINSIPHPPSKASASHGNRSPVSHGDESTITADDDANPGEAPHKQISNEISTAKVAMGSNSSQVPPPSPSDPPRRPTPLNRVSDANSSFSIQNTPFGKLFMAFCFFNFSILF